MTVDEGQHLHPGKDIIRLQQTNLPFRFHATSTYSMFPFTTRRH